MYLLLQALCIFYMKDIVNVQVSTTVIQSTNIQLKKIWNTQYPVYCNRNPDTVNLEILDLIFHY